MPKAPPEDLAAFVRRQPADDLASVLLELSDTLEPVRERLERMQLADRPDKLFAGSPDRSFCRYSRSSLIAFIDLRRLARRASLISCRTRNMPARIRHSRRASVGSQSVLVLPQIDNPASGSSYP